MKHFFIKFKNAGIKELLCNHKFIWSLLAIIAGCALTTWLIIHFSVSAPKDNSPLSAIPDDAAIIFEIKQPKELWAELSVNSGVWAELNKIETFSVINKEIVFLDSLFKISESVGKMMAGSTIYISCHPMTAGTSGFLYLTGLTGTCTESAIIELIKKAVSPKSALSDLNFMGTNIHEITMPGKKEKFIYTFSNNIFICSSQLLLVESSIRQQKSGISIVKDANFTKVEETTGKKVIADVYINFRYFPALFSSLTATSYAKRVLALTGFANWSALDLSVKKDAILLNGFTSAEDTTAGFLNLFSGQVPHEMLMLDVVPASTASFIYYGFSDFDSWYKSYTLYLKMQGTTNVRKVAIAKLNTAYRTGIEKSITTWIGKEMALVVTEPSDSDITSNMYAVIKANNISNAMKLLAPQTAMGSQKAVTQSKVVKDKKGKKKKVTTLKTEEQKIVPLTIESNKIYEYKIPGVMPALFGELFDGVQGTFYTIIGDYVVFANSSKALESFLKDYTDEKKLSANNNYIAFSKNISNESNIYLYCNIRKSLGIFLKYANKGIVDYMSRNFSNFKNFDAFAVQMKADKKLFYSNVCLKTNTTIVEESNALWTLKLDSAVFNRPQVVSDISGKSKKIIAFDNAPGMYMIDKDGSLLWKIELKEKPLSDVFVIDYAKDGKSEYMFNTQNYIYLVDKDGKSVGDFPLRLTDAATAQMTVVDYAGNKDYNLIVPCGDKIYCFTKEGALNKNWIIFKAKSNILKEVTILKFKGNDCLIAADKEGNVYILNKNGEENLKIKTEFTSAANAKFYALKAAKKSQSGILTTDNEGNLISILASGAVEKKTITKFSAQHFFLYQDFNSDKSNEYIFLDNNKLSVYDPCLKLLCSYTVPVDISDLPLYYTNSDGRSIIGMFSSKAGKIYLIKSDCTLCDGFPLNGTTPFSISSLNNDGSLNLIVGSERTIFNYSVSGN